MRRLKAILIMFVMVNFLLKTALLYAGPTIPMEEISEGIPNDLKDRIKLLYVDNPKKIKKALEYLGKNGERASVAVPFIMSMLDNLKTSGNPDHDETLSDVIEALGGIGDTRPVKLLISTLNYKSEKVRLSSIVTLGKLKDERAINPLIELMRKNMHVEHVMDALSSIGKPAVTPLLAEFKGSDDSMRINAAYTLGEIGELRAVEPLIKALTDDNIEVAKASAFALGEIKDTRAVDQLILNLDSGDNELCSTSAAALGKIKDSRAVEPLLKYIDNPDNSIRIGAIRALGAIKDTRAILPLIGIVDDKNWNVQRYTMWALKNISGKNFRKDKEAWIKWYEEEGKNQ